MTRLFGHGDLRLYLLKLLEEEPRHGYDIILQLESRFLGLYSPSPGTIYPRLQALVEEGYLEVLEEESNRKVYGITDAGREELEERTEELRELGQRVARSAREMAREIKEEVRSSVRDLRREMRDATRDVRREERRVAREAREVGEAAREVGKVAREVGRSLRDEGRQRKRRDVHVRVQVGRAPLEEDLSAFVADVAAALRRHDLDRDRIAAVRQALVEARALVIAALEGDPREKD